MILPYEKSLLAGRLGMTPETLSRSLATLRKLGVTAARDQVEIADLPGLEAFCRGAAAAQEQPKSKRSRPQRPK